MKKFVARQPIFDPQQKVFAYELLFRSGRDNFFDGNDPDQASTSVTVDSLLLMGMETLTGGDRAFINCTRNVLIKGYAALLPKDQVVVDILGKRRTHRGDRSAGTERNIGPLASGLRRVLGTS